MSDLSDYAAESRTPEEREAGPKTGADRFALRLITLRKIVLALISQTPRVFMAMLKRLTTITLLCLSVAAHSQPTHPEATGEAFTLKLLKRTGENFFSSLAYECNECSFEQFTNLRAPRGWSKSPTQMILPVGKLESPLSLEGVPSAIDFIPEIPGNEFKLIAKNLESEIIKIGLSGIILKSKVRRNTSLRYSAGTRIHELTDTEGHRYVLFAYEVESANFDRSYFENADAMTQYPRPRGWTYSSRIISADLELKSEGVVTVIAIRSKTSSVWEKR